MLNLFGGLVLAFTCLASGIGVGIVGKNGLHAISANKSSPFRLVLNLIHCEDLGVYGLIFAIIAASAFYICPCFPSLPFPSLPGSPIKWQQYFIFDKVDY